MIQNYLAMPAILLADGSFTQPGVFGICAAVGILNLLNGGLGVFSGWMYGRWFQIIEGFPAKFLGTIQLIIGTGFTGAAIFGIVGFFGESMPGSITPTGTALPNPNSVVDGESANPDMAPKLDRDLDPEPTPPPEREPEPYIPTLEDRLLASANKLHGGYQIQPPKTFTSISSRKGEDGEDWWWLQHWSSKEDGSWMAFAISGGPSFKNTSSRPRLSTSTFLGPRMESTFQRIDPGHSLTSKGYSGRTLDKQAVVRVKLNGKIDGRTPEETLYYIFYDNDVLVEIFGAIYHKIEDEELSPYMLGEYAANTFSSLQAEKNIPSPHTIAAKNSPSARLVLPPGNDIAPPTRNRPRPKIEFVTPAVVPVSTPPNAPKPVVQVNHKQEFERALIATIAMSHNGQQMACGADDGRTYIIDTNSKQVGTSFLAAKDSAVQQVAISPDGNLVSVSCVFGSDLAIWNADNGTQIQLLEKGKSASALAFSPNGKILAASFDNQLGLWDVSSGKRIRSVDVTGGALKISWAPNNNMLAIFNKSGDTIVWYPKGDRILYEKNNVRNGQVLAFTPDSRKLIVHGAYPSTVLVDLATATEEQLMRKDFLYRDMVFLEDGKHMAVVSETMVRIWDSQRKTPAKEAPLAVAETPHLIRLSADGSVVVMVDNTRRGPECIHAKPMITKD
ncbi:MAG: hypothetical protein ACI9HK_002335 [Pirellulaceae bacterium]